MNGTCNGTTFLAQPPWGGAERSNTIKSPIKSQFQRFLNQTLCVFSQMKDMTYQTGFPFVSLGHAPGMGFMGTVGGWGGIFNEIQPDLVCELLST